MLRYLLLTSSILLSAFAIAGEVDPKQSKWYEKYKTQKNVPEPEAMLLNTDAEPELTEGFTELFNGKDLTGWSPRGGACTFEVKNGVIVGTCVPGESSTYLSTDDEYTDFIFTCEVKWEVNGNSGVMFRAKRRPRANGKESVYGPQAEMEGTFGDRFWNGGIYGQDCGGYFYPMWLKEHQASREALDKTGWNRITIHAKGNVVKTWVNGVPAAHWVDDGSYPKGFFGLQVHSGKKGTVLFRDLRIKELGN